MTPWSLIYDVLYCVLLKKREKKKKNELKEEKEMLFTAPLVSISIKWPLRPVLIIVLSQTY